MKATVKTDNLDYPEALDAVLACARPVEIERLGIAEARSRVLAEDIVAPRAFPDTRRSAVDGYALGSLGLTQYTLAQTLAAEDLPQSPLAAEAAAAVMTGATVPDGAVAVVRVEDVTVDGRRVVPEATVKPGENINAIGEEAAEGQPVLQQGQRLDAIAYSVLCYMGIARAKVYRRPRVGVLITGNELLRPGQPHRPGMVHESNGYLLQSVLEKLGIEPLMRGPVADSPGELGATLNELARQSDLVVTSGGVSMGKFDFIRPLLHEAGYRVLVDRTKIKPGRPLLVAERDRTLFFGMPGYPAAFLVNLFVYLLPVLKRLCGLENVGPLWQKAILAAPVKGRAGRWDMIRTQLHTAGGGLVARPASSQLTSHYLNMANADGLIVLDKDCAQCPEKSEVDVLKFSWAFE